MESRRDILPTGEQVILIPEGTHQDEKIQRLFRQFGIECSITRDVHVEPWEERPMVIWKLHRYGGFDRISELVQLLRDKAEKKLQRERREMRRLNLKRSAHLDNV